MYRLNRTKPIHLFNKNRRKIYRFIKSFILSCIITSILFVFTLIVYYLIFILFIRLDYPKLTGYDAVLNLQPALSVVPIPDSHTALFKFKYGVRSSYADHLNGLIAFTQHYERYSQVNHIENCLLTKEFSFYPRKSCKFSLDNFEDCNIYNEFGLTQAQPCFIIKLNRIYGWIPDLNKGENDIKIACSGQSSSDTENIGPICYFDYSTTSSATCNKEFGRINHLYFPYMKQNSYRSPFIMIKLMGLKRNIVSMIKCSILNVKNANSTDFDSDVTFEILMD